MNRSPRPGGPHSPGSLNAAQRARSLARLAEERYDVIVVGGGVTGAGVALDAASRGLQTALVERVDLAAGTSRWSSKLVHGGLRYLAQGDLGIAYESARERHCLMTRIAPHLVRPLANIVPDTGRLAAAAGGAGIVLADALRRAARTPEDLLPRPQRVSGQRIRELVPAARPGLRGTSYYDGQLEDDARLVIALARTAAAYGADIVTHCAARPLGPDRAELADRITGGRLEARGHVVLATGVWGDEFEPSLRITPSRGSHLVLRAERLGFPRAQLSAPVPGHFGRFAFTVPLGDGLVLLGVTDEPAPGADGLAPAVPPEDEAFLLATMSTVLERPLTPADVVGRFAGLRPLVARTTAHGGAGAHGGSRAGRHGGSGAGTADASRRHLLIDEPGRPITVTGGKLTTYRRMAEDAVDAVLRRRGTPSGTGRTAACRTRGLPLLGAAPPEALAAVRAPARLVRRYGTLAAEVQALADADPALAQPVAPGCPTIAAEFVYGVLHEGALTVADLLERRTRVGFVEADLAAADPSAETALSHGG
ncbi:glycerol-3-phosphate dehydrogenase/oxidase [Sinomonas halotolerans]|uniref:Glycerol-3-phosphate dehydrogenase n=1 Tax=Sinomonas halotolerans TaxID=1644133 RepID=A0ABU9X2V2_9MICC